MRRTNFRRIVLATVDGGHYDEPLTVLRMAKIYNLLQDPFERANITSNTY
jgi:hypothetical protein